MVTLPWQIKEALRQVVSTPERMARRRVWRGVRRHSSRDPHLAFGGVLDGTGLVHGGAVKLLALRDAFPSNESDFNLLYLVSSAQPPFARDLVRLCKERGVVFVWNQNGVGYPAWAGREMERHNAPMRSLRALADFVIYQSEFCRTSAEKFLGSWTGPSATLVNPVDLETFQPPASPLPVKPLRLLAMGTQNYRERVFSTVDCLAVLRKNGIEATLTIAGNLQWPAAQAEVAGHVAAHGLVDAVTVLPAFTQEEAVRLYQGHHLVLHPKYLDPCPTVAIEALACGLPVVGSASGGLPELVPADCGRLIPVPLDWERLLTPTGSQLAAAVDDLLPRLPEFSAAARRHAEARFDARKWTARHAEIFRSLLAGS
jgi:glycosyltransferase involved in cell wall biosynthesis